MISIDESLCDAQNERAMRERRELLLFVVVLLRISRTTSSIGTSCIQTENTQIDEIMDQRDRHSNDNDDEEEERPRKQVQIDSQRSDSTSLPFGIANVLQANSTKISPPRAPSINPWYNTLQQLSQSSSSSTALANASNWCARCSMHFRLTSDLVHHIRVHHTSRRHSSFNAEQSTMTARKAMNNSSSQLKCHICSEIFRQRHHLTRHMTSHRWLKGREFILIKESKERDYLIIVCSGVRCRTIHRLV